MTEGLRQDRNDPWPGPQWGFGLYIHWPYCARICPYCDFNVYRARGEDPAPLAAAILSDMERWALRTSPRPLDTIYFGGGTPALLPARHVAALIEAAERLWGLAPDCEITLEANPNDAAAFADLRAAGVRRLSLGVQSLNDEELRFLGRDHDVAASRVAIDGALRCFDRVNLDFIYAFIGQSAAAWRSALAEALAIGAEHYSLYQLGVEPGTSFGRRAARGERLSADDERAAHLYLVTQELTEKAGAPAYEVSNHARGAAARARHNLNTWRGGDYVGVGPGAHGRVTLAQTGRLETVCERAPAAYAARCANGPGWSEALLDPADAAAEYVMGALRTAEGAHRARAAAMGLVWPEEALAALQDQGLARLSGDWLALTARGRLFADRIAADLAA